MMPAERKFQDYRSTYNDIRDWLRREKAAEKKEQFTLDYILELIFEQNKRIKFPHSTIKRVRLVSSALFKPCAKTC